MPEIKPLSVRSCPICRVAMVHFDHGWQCPQCGSAILDGSRGEPKQSDEAPEQSAQSARAAATGGRRA